MGGHREVLSHLTAKRIPSNSRVGLTGFLYVFAFLFKVFCLSL